MARPGWRNLLTLPSGSGRSPFQDNAATIYTIARTGAMLQVGQNRSKEIAALAAEPGCLQAFRFVALEDEDHARLRMTLESLRNQTLIGSWA